MGLKARAEGRPRREPSARAFGESLRREPSAPQAAPAGAFGAGAASDETTAWLGPTCCTRVGAYAAVRLKALPDLKVDRHDACAGKIDDIYSYRKQARSASCAPEASLSARSRLRLHQAPVRPALAGHTGRVSDLA
eukprot:scaffold124921_cov59-Phaeocystis_antarctica.AAC.8